jgi:chromatin segregation and condensation protein Rec8/ScpA/Scc1 (kleisin family)
MTDLTLYNIADQYLIDLQKLQEMEIDEQTFADTLEGLSGELELKATNVAMFVRNLEASAEAIKAAEKQMAERTKALESKADRIRQYLLDNMTRTGITKIDCPYFVLSVRKNPPAVEVLNQDMIPDKYFDIPEPPAPTLNKNRLKEDLKAGVIVEGAKLTAGQSLSIK